MKHFCKKIYSFFFLCSYITYVSNYWYRGYKSAVCSHSQMQDIWTTKRIYKPRNVCIMQTHTSTHQHTLYRYRGREKSDYKKKMKCKVKCIFVVYFLHKSSTIIKLVVFFAEEQIKVKKNRIKYYEREEISFLLFFFLWWIFYSVVSGNAQICLESNLEIRWNIYSASHPEKKCIFCCVCVTDIEIWMLNMVCVQFANDENLNQV